MADAQIIWFRQDLRLADQPAVRAAAEAGPVVALFVLDEESDGVRPMGGASRWWLHHSLAALDRDLRAMGGRLLLQRGPAARVIAALQDRLGGAAVHAMAHPEPWWPAIEADVAGLTVHQGTTLVPPGVLKTRNGGRFRVFTPFWRAHVAHGAPPAPVPAPTRIDFADAGAGDALDDWGLLPREPDWSGGFAKAGWKPGEQAARALLEAFLPKVASYDARRDFPSEAATSRLSPHLHFGEISAATLWHAAVARAGEAATAWTRQLVWRDFAHETLRLFPDSATRPHREAFDRLAWTDTGSEDGAAWWQAWTRGRTGYPLVDAGMRQLWQSGWMHNRVRMVTASFLVKHLRIDWRAGERWFWDTLLDADLANNAMGWQWVMGSGVDSSPYYRIFAPIGQSERFEAAHYIRRWVPELADCDDKAIHGPFPRGRGAYPGPIVDHAVARAAAMEAYRDVAGR